MLYFSLGYVYLYEHGLGAPELDLILEIMFMVMNLGPNGVILFSFVCIIALFCSLLGGIYGRARVLETTLPRAIPGFYVTRMRYLLIVFFLVLSAGISDLFFTAALAREFIAIRLILFSVLGTLLIWLDRSLGIQERGSFFWYSIMAMGILVSFLIGLDLSIRHFLL